MKTHLCLLTAFVLFCFAAASQEFSTHKYQLITNTLTWHQAKEEAERRGGHLATITSQAEHDHIHSLGLNFDLHPDDAYWLGATDEGHEGTWTWVTGEPFVFNRWNSNLGEPNNLGGENYLVSEQDSGHLWNDWGQSFHTKDYYLLEIDNAPFTTHTYRLVTNGLTWHQAKRDAELRGGHLATITSQGEFDYVISLGVLPSDFYWLGGTDEANPGTWTWVTGEAWDFTAWAPGEPNSLGAESYLHSLGSGAGHSWNNWNGSGTLSYYLLEIESPPCTPRKAKATAQLVNGFVVGATITDGGCGYTNPPVVLIQGGGGNGATAMAVISNGVVTAIEILNAGFSYDSVPRIVIGSPPFVPTVSIAVSKVNVTQNVVLGWKYVLESSTNAVDWASTGEPFVADSESIVKEFDAETPTQMFRLRVVP